MVYIARFLGAAVLFSGLVAGLPRPRPDSSDEAAVSAPYGIPLTEGAPPPPMATAASGCGSSGCGKMDSPPPPMKDSKMMESGCGSSGCGGSKQMTTSMAHEMATSTMMADMTTSTMMHEATSTMAAESKTTEAAMSMPTYGSGSSNWNMGSNSGYNDCVQQCMATFGMPAATYTPPTATAASTSTGTGATHTIIVAPTQGVLRFVPWAVNASAGDTVHFMWNANNHTVTKGSALLPCNKSNDSTTFATGQQSKGFTFDLKINDTEPIFFFCGTPTHCQKGMFAAINAPSSAGTATSVGSMIPALAANNSNVAAYAVYAANQTKGDVAAAGWGANLDLSQFPEWAHEYVVENTLYTRAFLGNNKDVVKDDGTVDLSAAGTNPLMIPQDLSGVLAASPSASSPSASSPASAAAQATDSTVAPGGGLATNGAASISSSKLAATLVVAFAAWILL
ncbi:hypothetical protein CPB83DRAFT_880548 [Crepidotus variabilis]|uniref:Phytocyanin domain-containing protein n=1 Tax=Crepidotus variabilis TaxID=179855 RepID=A0A9P6JUX8_9AGAR|nr:hypothetical protein CPB83DRAFT_880548 [Crepidotus variabilis]